MTSRFLVRRFRYFRALGFSRNARARAHVLIECPPAPLPGRQRAPTGADLYGALRQYHGAAEAAGAESEAVLGDDDTGSD